MDIIWLKTEYEFASFFSYRIPDSSTQYAVSSILPGPSTIKLAIVSTAIEMSGSVKYGEQVFEEIKDKEIAFDLPKSVSQIRMLIKRLKKKKDIREFEETFAIRFYIHFNDKISIYIPISSSRQEELREILFRIRYFGTSDSIVYCKNIVLQEPSVNSIRPQDNIRNLTSGQIIIPVKDLNPRLNFDAYNPYVKKKSKKQIFIRKFYFLPFKYKREGKNWILYEFLQ